MLHLVFERAHLARSTICCIPIFALSTGQSAGVWVEVFAITLALGPFLFHSDDVQYHDLTNPGVLIGNWLSMRFSIVLKTSALALVCFGLLWMIEVFINWAGYSNGSAWIHELRQHPIPLWVYPLVFLMAFGRWCMLCIVPRRRLESPAWYVVRPYAGLASWCCGFYYVHVLATNGSLTASNWSGPAVSSALIAELSMFAIALIFTFIDPADSWRNNAENDYVSESVWSDPQLVNLSVLHMRLWILITLGAGSLFVARYFQMDLSLILGLLFGNSIVAVLFVRDARKLIND